ncbi:MAG: hypothetical protein HY979_01165, partial [Candidatus Magasanikbacteria bacterium]|nr:hypothetical protein [Candidatus Magasanikbacteria bacterium]
AAYLAGVSRLAQDGTEYKKLSLKFPKPEIFQLEQERFNETDSDGNSGSKMANYRIKVTDSKLLWILAEIKTSGFASRDLFLSIPEEAEVIRICRQCYQLLVCLDEHVLRILGYPIAGQFLMQEALRACLKYYWDSQHSSLAQSSEGREFKELLLGLNAALTSHSDVVKYSGKVISLEQAITRFNGLVKSLREQSTFNPKVKLENTQSSSLINNAELLFKKGIALIAEEILLKNKISSPVVWKRFLILVSAGLMLMFMRKIVNYQNDKRGERNCPEKDNSRHFSSLKRILSQLERYVKLFIIFGGGIFILNGLLGCGGQSSRAPPKKIAQAPQQIEQPAVEPEPIQPPVEPEPPQQPVDTIIPPDTTAPWLVDLKVSNTAAGVRIYAETNQDAVIIIKYGLTTEYELGQISEASPSKKHSFLLEGLSRGKTYYYQILEDGVDNDNELFASFEEIPALPAIAPEIIPDEPVSPKPETPELPLQDSDVSKPQILSINTVNITENSFELEVITNKPAPIIIEPDRANGENGLNASSEELLNKHSFKFENLAPGIYYLRILAGDEVLYRNYTVRFFPLKNPKPKAVQLKQPGFPVNNQPVNGNPPVDEGVNPPLSQEAEPLQVEAHISNVTQNSLSLEETTLAFLDNTPPVVISKTISGVSQNSFYVNAETDENTAFSITVYDNQDKVISQASDADSESFTLHSIEVNDLLPETVYRIVGVVTDESGNTSDFELNAKTLADNSSSSIEGEVWPRVEVSRWPQGGEWLKIGVAFGPNISKDGITKRGIGNGVDLGDGQNKLYYLLDQYSDAGCRVRNLVDIDWPVPEAYFRWEENNQMVLKVNLEHWVPYISLRFVPGDMFEAKNSLKEKKVVLLPLERGEYKETNISGYFINLTEKEIVPLECNEWSLIGRLMDIIGYNDDYIRKRIGQLSEAVGNGLVKLEDLVRLAVKVKIANYGKFYPALARVLKSISTGSYEEKTQNAYKLTISINKDNILFKIRLLGYLGSQEAEEELLGIYQSNVS